MLKCWICDKEDSGFDFTLTIQPSGTDSKYCDACVKSILTHAEQFANVFENVIRERQVSNDIR